MHPFIWGHFLITRLYLYILIKDYAISVNTICLTHFRSLIKLYVATYNTMYELDFKLVIDILCYSQNN